ASCALIGSTMGPPGRASLAPTSPYPGVSPASGALTAGRAPPPSDGRLPPAAGRTSVLSAPGANRPAHVAVVLYVIATVLLAVIARPLWQPLVLAVVLAAPLASVNDRAARALGGRRTLAAALFTTGAILIIVLPIAAAALFVVEQAIDLANVVKTTLKQSGVVGLLEPLPDSIAQWLQHLQTQVPTRPRELLSRVNGWSQSGWALG